MKPQIYIDKRGFFIDFICVYPRSSVVNSFNILCASVSLW
jgi:hypothetical protein